MDDYPEMLIILGSGRSGTSYLQNCLANSFDFGFFWEPQFIIPYHRRLERYGNLERESNLKQLIKDILEENYFWGVKHLKKINISADDVFDQVVSPTYSGVLYTLFDLITKRQGKSRIGYKFPGDVLHIPTLKEIFPTARFIHMIRDGRDVALSLIRQKWGPTNLFVGSYYWARRTKIGKRDGSLVGDLYFEIRFEDLIMETTYHGNSLGKFIDNLGGSEDIDKLIDIVERTKNKNMVFKWKTQMTKSQIQICEIAAGEMLAECDYDLIFGNTLKIPKFIFSYYFLMDFFHRGWNWYQRNYRKKSTE